MNARKKHGTSNEALEAARQQVGYYGEVERHAAYEHESVHTWFGLSYANYLVVPRSILQSMSDEWQGRFVSCLQEMHEVFPDLEWPAYDVRVLRRGLQLIEEPNDCPQCDGAGDLNDDEECPTCAGTGTVAGDDRGNLRYETPEEVGFKRDPIPHYDRGRTRLDGSGERPDIRAALDALDTRKEGA